MPITMELTELTALLRGPLPTAPTADSTPPRREIVIADRGWVFVGMASVAPGGDVHLTDASAIRVWGTTRGLGQLALEGPQSSTKLDACGTVRVPASAVIARLVCTEGVWR